MPVREDTRKFLQSHTTSGFFLDFKENGHQGYPVERQRSGVFQWEVCGHRHRTPSSSTFVLTTRKDVCVLF